MEVSNRKWTDEEFLMRRKEVLAQWPTGQEVDIDEVIEYHKRLPKDKVFGHRLARAVKEKEILVQCGQGHATIEETIDHCKVVEEAGADLLFTHSDTYTRKGKHAEAQKQIENSKKLGYSTLNGFPVVCYGVANARRLTESTSLPQECSMSADEEPMLQAEIYAASGHTAFYNHDLQELVLHSKNYPLAKRIENAQYVARLASYYSERGALIHMHPYAVLCYTPPSLNIAVGLLNLFLNAGQGCKEMSLCQGLLGHLVQDIASIRAFKQLGEEYMQRFGYKDVNLTTGSWSFMGDWPRDPAQAAGMASTFAFAAALAPLDYCYQKSVQEAIGTTPPGGNSQSIKLTKQIIKMTQGQGPLSSPEIDEETEAIKAEARCIVDRVIEIGDSDPLKGELKAVESGILDLPFSSWTLVKDKVVPVRDVTGAIRYLETGNLPFTAEVIKRNKQKVAERVARDKPNMLIDLVVRDVKVWSEEITRVKR